MRRMPLTRMAVAFQPCVYGVRIGLVRAPMGSAVMGRVCMPGSVVA